MRERTTSQYWKINHEVLISSTVIRKKRILSTSCELFSRLQHVEKINHCRYMVAYLAADGIEAGILLNSLDLIRGRESRGDAAVMRRCFRLWGWVPSWGVSREDSAATTNARISILSQAYVKITVGKTWRVDFPSVNLPEGGFLYSGYHECLSYQNEIHAN